MMAELKPCPFCGSEAKLAHLIKSSIVYCGCCGASSKSIEFAPDYLSDEKAIEAWNNRAESEELKFTRQFIHEHGLDFALASAWKGRCNDGK